MWSGHDKQKKEEVKSVDYSAKVVVHQTLAAAHHTYWIFLARIFYMKFISKRNKIEYNALVLYANIQSRQFHFRFKEKNHTRLQKVSSRDNRETLNLTNFKSIKSNKINSLRFIYFFLPLIVCVLLCVCVFFFCSVFTKEREKYKRHHKTLLDEYLFLFNVIQSDFNSVVAFSSFLSFSRARFFLATSFSLHFT